MVSQLGSVPVYSGLTLAGVLATTGHGSGYQTTSGICDTLKEIVWVDGFGGVRHPATTHSRKLAQHSSASKLTGFLLVFTKL
jgi:hypothetical protein